jgi:DNA modification methylase
MTDISSIIYGHSTAESRWARFGPYYAMFPISFAFDVVKKYSQKGQRILDPFAGRGSSIFAGVALGRESVGIEINPVGWLYGNVKIHPALKEQIIGRLDEIYIKRNYYKQQAETLSEFYHLCYCDEVLKFLLAARKHLDWQHDNTDASLMAIILVHLHGKLGEGLSNQMRMTKSMGMNYSINWWKQNGLITPPEINPLEFLRKKIDWRYEKGLPKFPTKGQMIFGDSTDELSELNKKDKRRFDLLFTSPPYCSITNYHSDQWLRLWMLGEPPEKTEFSDNHRNRFINKENYYLLLESVFDQCSKLLNKQAIIYVRTDAREFTYQTTLNILKECFPKHHIKIKKQPLSIHVKTQTQLFGDITNKPGEIDIVLNREVDWNSWASQ